MKQNSDDVPVACCLSSAELRSVRQRSLPGLGSQGSELKNSLTGTLPDFLRAVLCPPETSI